MQRLDYAETWIAKQILGSNMFAYGENTNFIRNKLKNRIFEEIRRFIVTAGLNNPPFEPEEIAKFRKVLRILEDQTLTLRESYLIPVDGGFIIKLNPQIPEVRRRFSCAHEIGHTYFYDLNANPPQKFYPVSRSRHWVEEGYACEIAREILLPEPYLSKFVLRYGYRPSVQALIELRRDFNVSYEVLAKRLLHDAHLWNTNFWGDNLWQTIIIIATILPTNNSELKIDVFRSPKYRNKLKKLKDNENIRKLISDTLQHNAHPKKDVQIGRIKCCVEVSRVGIKSAVAVIYENI